MCGILPRFPVRCQGQITTSIRAVPIYSCGGLKFLHPDPISPTAFSIYLIILILIWYAEEEKNGCVMLVKRFIDIPPYLKWDRGAAFHKCMDTIARLLSGVLNMRPSGGDIRKL
jgi:hypothetical protein